MSISTASLVFSGRGPVSAPTAERVRGAARDLGYAGPDPLASSLRQGRAGVVGVLVEDRLLHAFRDPYVVSVLDGLAEVLDAIPTGLLLMAQPGGTERLLEHVATLAVDAFVFSMCGQEQHPLVDVLASRGVPMVGTGTPVDPRVTQVLIDERAAKAMVAAHLRDLGHRRVGHVTMPLCAGTSGGLTDAATATASSMLVSRERARGVIDVFGTAVTLAEAAEIGIENGRAAGRLLLDVPAVRRPSAVVAQSDLLAIGVIRAADDLGLEVPGDVSVTGFDGVALPWFPGRLTTVDQHGQQKGRIIGELVADRLAGKPVDDVRAPAELRLGSTSAAPPTDS